MSAFFCIIEFENVTFVETLHQITMKKIILSIAALAVTVFASAQLPLRVDVMGNFSQYSFRGSNTLRETLDSEFAFGARAMFDVSKQNDNSTFEIGLGYQANKTHNSQNHKTMTIHNLTLPFGYSYEHHLGNSNVIFSPRLGFFLAYAIDGKTALTTNSLEVSASPFEGDGGLKRFDIGSDDQLAFIFADHISVSVGYQFSLIGAFGTLCKDKDVDVNYDNLYISVGYKF